MSRYETRTMVLVGRVGNGKSAAGNSVLGQKKFISRAAMASVTSTSEIHSRTRSNGQVINVIDTPGLFDPGYQTRKLAHEIVKCLDLAKDGVHAVLLVYKINDRFSLEEEAAIEVLKEIFGSKIIDYMVIVFTGADKLEKGNDDDDDDDDDDETSVRTPEEYLAKRTPESLKRIISICRNRCVFFNNKTKDEAKKEEQLHKLLDVVNTVVRDNDEIPFTSEMRTEHLMEEKLKESVEKVQREFEQRLKMTKDSADAEIGQLKQQIQQVSEEKDNQHLGKKMLNTLCDIL